MGFALRTFFLIIYLLFFCRKITRTQVTLPPIQNSHIEQFFERAHQQMDEIYTEFNKNIYNKGNRQTPGSPAWYMALSHAMKPDVFNMSHMSLVVEEATRYMSETYLLSPNQITHALPLIPPPKTLRCPLSPDPPCRAARYRSISGYCNNVQSPHWGSANLRYARLIPSAYFDGISLPRGGGVTSKGTLPGARDVSVAVHAQGASFDDEIGESNRFEVRGDKEQRRHGFLGMMGVVWMQFVKNDLSYTPFANGYNGTKLKCCGVSFTDFHPECFPIKLSPSNPSPTPSRSSSTSRQRERCQEFIRSATVPRIGCSLGPREQMNQATAYLDASTLYGNSRGETEKLRIGVGGRLKNRNEEIQGKCSKNEEHCFLSRDIRANENIGLFTLYDLWVREHNRIADGLYEINPHWNDETLFQEARRIVIAEIQHITYNEFLPTVLSQNMIDRFDLKLTKNGYFTGYDINKNPAVINSVAHAAMWFIATLIPDVLLFLNSKRQEEKMNFADTFFTPNEVYKSQGFEKILEGLLQASTMKDDATITPVMVNNMFKDSKYKGAGLDLAAQIIQRGRDHGLPSYTEYRKFCGLKHIKKFNDLNGITTPKIAKILQAIYKNVSDIDLFTGGLSEISMLGSVIGPTFSCLLGYQFQATKIGDRHWYENDLPPSSFSLKQLEEIRKVTLSRIICDNSNIRKIQPNAFLISDFYLNEKMSCDETAFKKLNLLRWKHDKSLIILDSSALRSILTEAQNDIQKLYENENYQYVQSNSPIVTAFKFNRPKRQATLIANTSLLLQLASSRIVENYIQSFQDQEVKKNFSNEELHVLISTLSEIDLTNFLNIPQTFQCDESNIPCDHTTQFRTVTGKCNNLNNPDFGTSMRSFNRLLPPIYDDGIGSPRFMSTSGSPLPSARLISTRLHPDVSYPHDRYSLFLMQLAQLTDHDLTHTPVASKHIGQGVLDCSPCRTTTDGCIPIPVPENDDWFPQGTCIPVTRSLPSRLTLGYREQMNQVTAYLDCSFIYGSDTCEAKSLRSFIGGKLNVTEKPNMKPLLPEQTTNPECRSESRICFRAGDIRASEQPGLATIHTIFLREHNRIAEELSKINRHWNDETIYQHSRRIVIASFQHVLFSELLPRIFGWEHLEKYGLSLEKQGYFTGYDPNCDPTLVNEFSAAAYRFGHSLLRPIFKRMNNKHVSMEPEIRLRDHFFNPELLYKDNMIDQLIIGLSSTPMETLDQFITTEVKNHLFEDKNLPFSGMDLPAINIQRGRDHGLQGYNFYREYCNLTKAQSFKNLEDLIPAPIVHELSQLYEHVDDIDLFPGGLTESPLKGGIVGPTIACIIGGQFNRLRKCDRFWYENDNPFTRFTIEQLEEIRRTTLSRLICDNTDNVHTMQKHALDLPDPFLNPRIPCKNYDSINLELWKDQKRCLKKNTIIETGDFEKVSPCVMCICSKEGMICESMKIDNCYELLNSHSWDNILKDAVCKVQCAHIFRSSIHQNDTQFEFT